MSREGKPRNTYKVLIKNGDLAELIGVILGDGHIGKLARCESLRIVGNSSNEGFINRYSDLVEKVFDKKPHVARRKTENAFNITLYEKHLSERLEIPTGSRLTYKFLLPSWIKASSEYRIRFLRGLYEAEGSLSYHPKTYTHKLIFSNRNESLNRVVMELLTDLGFHPHYSIYKVQVSRKEEVQNLKDLLQFRDYDS